MEKSSRISCAFLNFALSLSGSPLNGLHSANAPNGPSLSADEEIDILSHKALQHGQAGGFGGF